MDSENVVCPVCTLFLRPGITLKSHLTSHPKHKVIEALVRLSSSESTEKVSETATQNETASQSSSQVWSQTTLPVNPAPPNFAGMSGNHSFIYQQFMSSTTPQTNVLNMNPLTQQVVTIPAVFNSQMMCLPYMYQQQQVIMSSGPSVMPLLSRPLPIELPPSPQSVLQEHTRDDQSPVKVLNEQDEPELIDIGILRSNVNESDDAPKSADSDSLLDHDDLSIDKEETEIDLKPNCVQDDNVKNNEIKNQVDDDVEDVSNSECVVHEEFAEAERRSDSPHSIADAEWNVKVRSEVDKSCQTQTNNYSDVQEIENLEQVSHEIECKLDCYYTDNVQENVPVSDANYAILQNSYSQHQHDSAYSVSETHTDNVYQEPGTVIDMDGMNLLITNDCLNSQLVSQVVDFDCVSSERPRVLMNIGGIETTFADHREVGDESMSRESANVRADEHMPPRGELSGQESNSGTSWNRVPYQEGSCGISVCTSYDLIARETWEGSDVSDAEAQPAETQSSPPPPYVYDNDDTPTVSGFRKPPITYKCPACDESFNCPKERRLHQRERHDKSDEKPKSNEVIGTKRIKKLIIKPKKSEIKAENNFDNVFTNKLKIENNLENDSFDRVSVILPPNSSQPVVQKTEESLVNNPLVCTICNTVVSDNNALKEHQLEVHKFSSDVKHQCRVCEEHFPNEVKYTEHLKIHPLECRLCGKFFYRRPNLQLHVKRHLGIKPYKCNICEKAFLTKQKHDEHKNIHTGDAPIKCNLCEDTFRRHSNLVQHRNKHHFNQKKKLKDYVCFCGEFFHSKKKLAWHKEIHDAKPKGCTHCSEKFIHMSSLTRHMRRAHNERFVPTNERGVENVECPICKGVYLRSSLEVHIRNHSGQRPFTCLICNKDFTTKWNLKLHKWTHAARTSKPFKCDQCKGAFIRETDYVAHMNSHKSVRPYTCNYCGAQFIRKYNCQRHVKEHEKVKTFSCQVCGKCFHRSYYLKDHMRVHSGLRPYACHVCGKTSTTKSNHNKHVRIHHAREPVSAEN